jgi:sugar lactone lactonase YvrE
MTASPTVLRSGLMFPEGPRWYDDRLWVSDMHAHRVLTVDLSGTETHIADFDDKPSGIGFLHDGTPIVVSMRKRLLRSIDKDGNLSTYADLNTLPGHALNDMIVDGRERAYVTNRVKRGYSPAELTLSSPTSDEGLILVERDGSMREVARDLFSPNGLVITPDYGTLIVAESRGCRIVAFDLLEDGSLTNRRLFADTEGLHPDGIALDSEGAVWMGAAAEGVFRRIMPDGRVAQEIALPEGQWAVACALGGPDRRTLFLITAWTTMENIASCVDFEADKRSTARGAVEVVEVDVPGAGWP